MTISKWINAPWNEASRKRKRPLHPPTTRLTLAIMRTRVPKAVCHSLHSLLSFAGRTGEADARQPDQDPSGWDGTAGRTDRQAEQREEGHGRAAEEDPGRSSGRGGQGQPPQQAQDQVGTDSWRGVCHSNEEYARDSEAEPLFVYLKNIFISYWFTFRLQWVHRQIRSCNDRKLWFSLRFHLFYIHPFIFGVFVCVETGRLRATEDSFALEF